MKKLLTTLLLALLTLAFVLFAVACSDVNDPDSSENDDIISDGTPDEKEKVSEGLAYELSANGKYYTVTGIGTCTDTDVVIPSKYKSIPVTVIGSDAFANCTSLVSVKISDGVTSIDFSAFYNCTNLTSVTIPDSVTTIGYAAFYECKSLTNVKIGAGVKNIRDCFGRLLSYNEYDNAYYLGNDVNPYRFLINAKDKSISSVIIHEKTETIQDSAFLGCTELVEVTIPDSVKIVGIDVFHDCSNLQNVVFGDGVTSIGEFSFKGCVNLTNISIPDSLEECGNLFGFTSIPKLAYTLYNNGAYLGNEENPYVLLFSSLSDGDVIVHEKTRVISGAAFAYSKVRSISIPKSVVGIGRNAFEGGADSVYIEDLTAWCNIKFSNYSMLGSLSLANPISSGAKLYLNKTLVEEVVIPESITSINAYAFYGYKYLKSVVIGNNVKDIGNYAFHNCSSLTSVVIGEGITSIADYAFNSCDSLENVYYLGTFEEWNSISVGSSNDSFVSAPRYYYSEELPTDNTYNYWHYVDGVPTKWEIS